MQDSVYGVSKSNDNRLMIIGDYPNQDELVTGEALSGKVGNQIASFLRQQGGPRFENVYRTSVIKAPISGVGTRNKKTRNKLIQEALNEGPWLAQLLEEINQIRPNVIIGLGELVLNSLCNLKHIGNYRGSILKLNPQLGLENSSIIKVIPTYHPRMVWEDMKSQSYVGMDYKKAIKLLDYPGEYKRDENIWLVDKHSQLFEWWQRARRAKFITIDIETFAGFITCMGFCHDGKEAISIPLWEKMKGGEQVYIWKLLASILSSDTWFVNQNIGYDQHWLEKWNFPLKHIWDDTMLLMHSLYPELPKRLAFSTSVYTDQPYYKDEGKEFNPKEHEYSQLLYYNAKDALVTWQVYAKQVEDAKSSPVWPGYTVWDFHRERVWPLYNTYRRINARGIRVDISKRDQLINRYENDLEKYQSELDKYAGKTINTRSFKEMGQFIYGELGFKERWHETPSGGLALDTDKETIEDICINECDPHSPERLILRTTVLIRKIETVLRYLKKILHDDGRLRSVYKLSGTKSGRTSGDTHHDFNLYRLNKKGPLGHEGKIIYEYKGASLQTLPKRPFEAEEFEGLVFGSDIPSIFIPSEGYVFVEGDGGAAEARVVAVLADDFDTLAFMDKAVFKRNEHKIKDDLHTFTAMACMDYSFESITEYIRDTYGKRPRHAGNYDMGEYRLSQMIHKTVAECKVVLDKFHEFSPKIRQVFHETIRQLLLRGPALISPHGRRRDFFGRRDAKLFKEAFSYIPQATVSDHTKSCIQPVIDKHPDAYCILEKHDSLLFEAPLGQEYELAGYFKEQMERPIDFRKGSIIRDFELSIPAEVKIGEPGANWLELKEVKF